MIVRKNLWQTLALILVVAMLVSALPAAPIMAQSTPVVSSTVRGELNEQFAKHYLELRVTNPSNPVRLVMEVNPQDRQELDNRAGFYVFDEAGFQGLINGGRPELLNLAVGALQTTGGVKQRVAVIANPVGSFTVVPFNDSTVPMDYTLTVENAVLVDGSGEQVTNPLAASQTVTQTADNADATPTATPAATRATTTTVATAAATPTAAAATVVQVTTRVVRVDELKGELNERFAKHYYELEVQDITRNVVIDMTYNPQDQQALDNGLNFYVLTEDQFRNWTNPSLPNTSAGNLLSGTPKTKRATIGQPLRNYTVVVANDSDVPADYTLSVQNAVLIDESGQSITAQALGATGVTTTTVSTAAAAGTSTTTTAATTPAATATPVAEAITPPTTYTVARGDTMGTIARRAYGNSQLYQQLCTYNNIANCDRIEIGDEIEIPLQSQLGGTAATTAATPTATPAPTVAAAAAATPAATTAVTTTTATTGSTTTTAANAGASGDLVATTGSLSVLDTLGLLLDLLELEQDQTNNIKAILQGGTYTFFAPTDTAFTSLDEATLEGLIANPEELAAVLKAHIVPGQVLAADLTNGASLQTLAGTSLPVTVNGSTVTVGGATVSQADVLATNGVIHIIDSVLVQ